MKTFDTLPLWLTPLTPIHVGCGIDFEPTNYVIDEGVLFAFEPSRASISDADRKALGKAVSAKGDEAIRGVQRFFYDRRGLFVGVSHLAVAVAPGVARQYEARIGQVAQRETGGGRVANQLEIERTAHHPHSGNPILPGSSLKGAMRTAWLDTLNQGAGKPAEDKSAADVERRLLGGAFHTDPFRLLRVADANGAEVLAKVVFSTNHKKRVVMDKNGQVIHAQGPTTRRETIVGGQLRCLQSEIRFDHLGERDHRDREDRPLAPSLAKRIADFATLARACNSYYLPRLESEFRILAERRFSTEIWLSSFRTLISELKPGLDAGALMLLRVGRHSGAESVTLDGIRSIRIMTGRGQPPQWSPTGAKTLWLAADREDDRSGMLPFGWLLIEPADRPDVPELKRWCDAQPKPDLSAIRSKLAESREKAAAEAAAQEQLARERAAREAEEQRLAHERETLKANLSEQGRLVEALREKLDKHTGRKQPVSGSLYAEVQKLLKPALQEGWADADKLALAELITGLGFGKIDFGGKTKEIKRAIAQLKGEG
jgi:CRISPR-associated protein Csm5